MRKRDARGRTDAEHGISRERSEREGMWVRTLAGEY
jgi:hypothetical protein